MEVFQERCLKQSVFRMAAFGPGIGIKDINLIEELFLKFFRNNDSRITKQNRNVGIRFQASQEFFKPLPFVFDGGNLL